MRFSFGPPRRKRTGQALPLLALLALATLGSGGSGTRATAESLDQLIEAVQERYQTIRDIRATFEQEGFVASIGRRDISRGKVTIERPGRMRWEYQEPDPRVIALDGETLQMYVPQDQQLQIVPIEGGTLPPTALDFLLRNGDLRKSFAAESLPADPERGVGLRLRPRQDASFEFVDLWVAPDSHQLRESVVQDLFGNRTTVRFSDVVENTGVERTRFQIDVPDDTEIIDLRSTP